MPGEGQTTLAPPDRVGGRRHRSDTVVPGPKWPARGINPGEMQSENRGGSANDASHGKTLDVFGGTPGGKQGGRVFRRVPTEDVERISLRVVNCSG